MRPSATPALRKRREGLTLLVVTAVEAERDAILAALRDRATLSTSGQVEVAQSGVGPAAAAAATSAALATGDYDLVISAGIGGGFEPIGVGAIAVAATIAFADLGADTDAGFVPMSALGFGTDRYDVPAQLAIELTDRTGGHLGTILTVATVTGTAERAHDLRGRFPDAVAEAMEGAGVAAAAALHGVPFAEVRAISNSVGPRDREAWRIPDALAALGRAVAAITNAPLEVR
ncbi:MAG: futalosine hydrolase [Pseudonocardiales bacterium]|jgi:futalosine hydrolase|nr:futalosine hydrolase [Pseudonocardiales bacterium]MDT4972196.1 futalosine hydrolase [Pseudonocardiales bacterium]